MSAIIEYVKHNLSTILIFGVLLGWILYQRIPMAQASGRMENHPAPDFELSTLEGERVHLTDLRGKVVVVNFWATWCVPCRVEIPLLKSIYGDLKESGLIVLGVTQDEKEQVAAFVKDHEIPYPILLDSQSLAAEAYGIRGYPTLVLIDREGNIRTFTTGLNFLMNWQIRHLTTGRWI